MVRSTAMRGAFVISIDFELHWGVFDHVVGQSAPYMQNLLGEWQAVPAMLALMRSREIAATWATVGLLFARTREEQERFRPKILPRYRNPRLNPYAVPVGDDEAADSIHFAPSLIRKVRDTPLQEIATHTFSHYYCLEEGSTPEAFREDLRSAAAIAGAADPPFESIVLPRNQVNGDYLPILQEFGIHTYRGTESGWMYRSGDGEAANRSAARLCRLVDAYISLSGPNLTAWSDCVTRDGLANVPATRFLRPYCPQMRMLDGVRLARIANGIAQAARTNRIYHLTWHPHNFGVNLEANLDFLRRVLDVVARFRESHGLQSMTMAAVGRLARRAQ